MISTTLNTNDSTLPLSARVLQNKAAVSVKAKRAPRNWALLLVFLVAPAVMLALSACILVLALG